MFGVGLPEMAVIALVAVIVFGPDKLPELAKQAGAMLRKLREFANSARDVLSLLQTLNRTMGKTIIMVTHDPHSAAAASRVIHLDKGKFVDAEPGATASASRGAVASASA